MRWIVVVLVVPAALAGCGGPMVDASKLEADIAQYQQTQQTKIDSLNQQYRATYTSLVANLKAVDAEQRRLQFDEDSQRIADQVIAGWPQTAQPSQLHDLLSGALADQLKRVQASDDDLAAQKAAYAALFQALNAHLKKLDEARANLHALAGRDKLDDQMQKLFDILVAAGKDLYKKK